MRDGVTRVKLVEIKINRLYGQAIKFFMIEWCLDVDLLYMCLCAHVYQNIIGA